jgi:hypothetical protein
MARDPGPSGDDHSGMADVVVLLVVAAILGLLGFLVIHGWAADSRDAESTHPTFPEWCHR